jgi:hypothetical protein
MSTITTVAVAATEASTATDSGKPHLASPGSAQQAPTEAAAIARTANATEYEVAVAMAPATNAPIPVPASKLRFHAMLTEFRADSPPAANACVSVRFCRPP